MHMDSPIVVPDELPVIAIRNAVLFPGAVMPFDIGRPRSLAAVAAGEKGSPPLVVVLTQKAVGTEDPGEADFYPVGCAALILKTLRHTSGNVSLIVQGIARVGLLGLTTASACMTAKLQSLPADAALTPEQLAIAETVRARAKTLVKMMPDLPPEAQALLDSIQEPGAFVDLVSANIDVPVDVKFDLLSARLPERIELLLERLDIEIAAMKRK
jgi:ATP-dependent Lon protease